VCYVVDLRLAGLRLPSDPVASIGQAPSPPPPPRQSPFDPPDPPVPPPSAWLF